MKIEVLFPEFCNLFGDAYNMVYLEKTLPEAEFIRTKFSDDVRFTEEKMNLVYMGPMTERMQEQVIRKLMPLKEKIQKAIDDGTVFLFTGNALEIFGDYIENEDGSRVECLGLYCLYAKRDMMHRHNSDFEGEFDGNVIMGFKTQFTMAYTPDESHGLFVKNKGVGLNIKAKYEGIRVNNFFGTYLVGPILVLNPPFTKYILNLMGAGDVKRCVAYGMITSDMGLLEIPHVPAPASAADLRDAMRAQRFPEIAPFPIHFIPGVRNFAGPVDLDNFGMMDMMRGEETEAVGLFELLEPETSAMFILPGSHNKFVAMSAEGKILGCMTSISGELLDAMTHHTILADAVGGAFVSPEAYNAKMAMEGARACAQNGLGRAAFSGRILKTLGKRSHAEVQSYLLGAALALDVQAMEAFLPDQPEEIPMPDIVIPLHRNLGAALGVAPDMSAPREIVEPRIYVAGKAPVQQAMIDVLEALGHEGAIAVPRELSARMGVTGAAEIGL